MSKCYIEAHVAAHPLCQKETLPHLVAGPGVKHVSVEVLPSTGLSAKQRLIIYSACILTVLLLSVHWEGKPHICR